MKAGNQTDDISDDQMDEIYFYFSHMETGEKDHDEISKSAVVNEEITLTNSHNCKTDNTSDEMDYTKTGEQECYMITESTALSDHEKNMLMNPYTGKTIIFEELKYVNSRYAIALAVAATAATLAIIVKVIFDKPGYKDLIKFILSGADTGTGVSMLLIEKCTCNFQVFFSIYQLFHGMEARQNTQTKKPKQLQNNSEHAHRSQRQQHAVQAPELDSTELNGGMDEMLNEGKYNDLIDGRYEKTIYVKTWTGKSITVEIDLRYTVDTVKGQIEAKMRIPRNHQHLTSKGKVLMGKKMMKDYNITGSETIEMTALLLGGTKHKSLSPTPVDAERDKKRFEYEPYIDLTGLEDEKPESAASEEETSTTKKWMKSMMKDIRDRTDDISEFEKTMTEMKFEMEEVRINMKKMSEAFTKIVDESQSRVKKFEELFLRINDDIRARDKRTEARFDGVQKHIDAKIDEKFSDLEARMSAMEKNKPGTIERSCRDENSKENPRTVPIECKAAVHGFKEDSHHRWTSYCKN